MDYNEKDFGKILKKNALSMRRLVLQEGTECMRVYDRNLPFFPVTVDLYGQYARITDYSDDGLDEETIERCSDIVRRMCYIQSDHVVFHRRNKIGKEQHEVLSEQSLLVEVKESGHTFTVDLTKRIDTGLFLDHMRTRQMVEQMSNKLRVLNLFSYTGSFSVYAAAGGALSVDSVDLSSTYTEWAKDNLLKNGFEGENYKCIAYDALKFIIESVKESRKYDLIIFDPPSFSNSRKMDEKFDVSKDYLRYFNLLNNLLEKDGVLIFSTNLSSFHMDSGRVKGFKVTHITKEVTAPGFTKAKGTSRTWLLNWQSHVRLQKRDYEGNAFVSKAKDSANAYWQENKEQNIMDNEKEMNEEVVEILTNTEETKTEIANEKVVADAIEETVEDVVVVEETVEASDETVAEEAAKNDFDKIIEDLEESAPVVNVEDDMLSLNWDDSEIVAPEVKTKSKPRAVTTLADRKNSSRDENNFQSDRKDSPRDNDRRSDRGDRKSFGRDNDRRDDRRPSYGRDNDRRPSFGRDNDRRDDRRPSYGRDNDRRPSFGRDNDRRDDRRPSYGRDNDRRPSFGRDNDRRDDRRPSYGRDNDRRPSFGRDNDRRDDRRPSYGRDNDRKPSFGRDNDRRDDRRPSYGRDNDRKPSFGRDNGRRDDRRPSYGRDNDRKPSFGRDNDRRDDRRPSYGRDNDRKPSFSRDNDRRDDRRPSYGRDNDRKPSFSRDNDRRDDRRPSYGRDNDRKPSFSRDNDRRDDRRPSYGRDNDRKPSFSRDNDRRPSYGRDNDRKPSFSRDNDRRPSFNRDDRKPSFSRDNDRRPSFNRDDRKPSFSRDNDRRGPRRGGDSPKPYGFDNVKKTRTRGEDEGGFFWLSNDKKDK